ncbi:MAG: hypothetical protein MZV64_63330 [Ignavibacteriales bacterium]|nr:hypothetical protein [Ignavibacteriales bacterium]
MPARPTADRVFAGLPVGGRSEQGLVIGPGDRVLAARLRRPGFRSPWPPSS